jgi:hypothetical protein
MAGEQVGHAADLAPAHGIGLAGERERAAARLADLAGGEMQVDQRGIVVRAVARLVEALAPERQRALRLAEPARGGDDVFRLDTADVGAAWPACSRARWSRRASKPSVWARMKSLSTRSFPQQHVQHRVVERDVAAGLDRQVQVGGFRRVGAARIDDDQLQRGWRAGVLDAAEQHRVGEGRVGAGDQQAVGVVDVLVGCRAARRRRAWPCSRPPPRHAQARVGVDVVGADQALGQLVEDVVVLGQQLAGDVEGDASGPCSAMVARTCRRRARAPRPS